MFLVGTQNKATFDPKIHCNSTNLSVKTAQRLTSRNRISYPYKLEKVRPEKISTKNFHGPGPIHKS